MVAFLFVSTKFQVNLAKRLTSLLGNAILLSMTRKLGINKYLQNYKEERL